MIDLDDLFWGIEGLFLIFAGLFKGIDWAIKKLSERKKRKR